MDLAGERLVQVAATNRGPDGDRRAGRRIRFRRKRRQRVPVAQPVLLGDQFQRRAVGYIATARSHSLSQTFGLLF